MAELPIYSPATGDFFFLIQLLLNLSVSLCPSSFSLLELLPSILFSINKTLLLLQSDKTRSICKEDFLQPESMKDHWEVQRSPLSHLNQAFIAGNSKLLISRAYCPTCWLCVMHLKTEFVCEMISNRADYRATRIFAKLAWYQIVFPTKNHIRMQTFTLITLKFPNPLPFSWTKLSVVGIYWPFTELFCRTRWVIK